MGNEPSPTTPQILNEYVVVRPRTVFCASVVLFIDIYNTVTAWHVLLNVFFDFARWFQKMAIAMSILSEIEARN